MIVTNKRVLLVIAFASAVLLTIPGWRTAAMAAAGTGIIWLYLYKKLHWYSLLLSVIFAAGLLLIKQGSSGGRWFIIQQTVTIIKNNPRGIGFGRFAVEYGLHQAAYFRQHGYDDAAALLADNTQFALNEYLQVAAEGGIAAGMLFVSFTIAVLFAGVRLYRKKDSGLLLAAITGFTAVSVSNAAFYMLHNWWVLLFYCSCAAAIILLQIISVHKVAICCSLLTVCGAVVAGIHTYREMQYTKNLSLTAKLSMAGYRVQSDSLFDIAAICGSNNINYQLAIARHYLNYAKPAAAIIQLKKAAAKQTHSNIYNLLGAAYLIQQDTLTAVSNYEMAVNIVPKFLETRKKLADIYRSMNDAGKEKHWLQSIINLPQKTPSAVTATILHAARARLLEIQATR
jgi:tetratricopeptide (TPR) repeat protein